LALQETKSPPEQQYIWMMCSNFRKYPIKDGRMRGWTCVKVGDKGNRQRLGQLPALLQLKCMASDAEPPLQTQLIAAVRK